MSLSIDSKIFIDENYYSLTASQFSCSQVIQGFSKEACNPLTLFSLVLGGVAARSIELTCLKLFSSSFSKLTPHLASLSGIATEGAAFAGIPMIQTEGSWSEFGIGTGHGALVIGLSRVVGRYTHSSFLISWMAQDCTVMTVDVAFETLHLREVQSHGIAERWFHARAVAFQMHISAEICNLVPSARMNRARFEIEKERCKKEVISMKVGGFLNSFGDMFEQYSTAENIALSNSLFSENEPEFHQKFPLYFMMGNRTQSAKEILLPGTGKDSRDGLTSIRKKVVVAIHKEYETEDSERIKINKMRISVVQQTIELIDRIHSIKYFRTPTGRESRIPIRLFLTFNDPFEAPSLKHRRVARYARYIPRTRYMLLNAAFDDPFMKGSLVHEFGHLVDHLIASLFGFSYPSAFLKHTPTDQGLNPIFANRYQFGDFTHPFNHSRPPTLAFYHYWISGTIHPLPVFRRLKDALRYTGRVAKPLAALFAIDSQWRRGEYTPETLDVVRKALYAIDPKEIFADAYLQYIAQKTGDPDLKIEIARQGKIDRTNFSSASSWLNQWSDEEFEPIYDAMEDVFSTLQWKR